MEGEHRNSRTPVVEEVVEQTGPRPDGPKAVCVAIATSWMYLIIFGTIRSSGVFYEAVIKDMKVSRSSASWPFTLTYSFLLMMGIVTAMLCRVLPLRSLAMLGSIIATLSVAACFFIRGIITLSLLYGIFQGIGYGLIVVPSVMIVNQYFERHRATANGIQMAGSSLGAMALPPLIDLILHKTNSLHVTFFFTSIIVLTCIFGAFFYSTPPWLIQANQVHNRPSTYQSVGETYSSNHHHNETIIAAQSNSNTTKGDVDEQITGYASRGEASVKSVNAKYVSLRVSQPESSTIVINDENMSLLDRSWNSSHNWEYTASWTDSIQSSISGCGRACRYFSDVKGILKTPIFWKILIAYSVIQWDFYLYLLFLVDYGVDRGMKSSMAAYLLSAVSLADLLGRLCTGWISDLGYAKRGNVVAYASLITAIVFLLTPFTVDLSLFCLLAVIAGVSTGTMSSLIHVLQVEYIGLDNLPLTAGVSHFFNGILILFRPLVIGIFRDTIGSYDGLLFVLCAVGVVTFVVWKIEMCLHGDSADRNSNRV